MGANQHANRAHAEGQLKMHHSTYSMRAALRSNQLLLIKIELVLREQLPLPQAVDLPSQFSST